MDNILNGLRVFGSSFVSAVTAMPAESFVFMGGLLTKTCLPKQICSLFRRVLSKIVYSMLGVWRVLSSFFCIGHASGAEIACQNFAAVGVPSCRLVSNWPGLQRSG